MDIKKEQLELSELRQWRLDVITQMLRVPTSLLGVFLSSEAGKKSLQLADSELLYEELNEDEEKLLNCLKGICLKEKKITNLISSWMAIQLFLLPYQVETLFRPNEMVKSLPPDLLEVGLCLLLRKPKIMLKLGETDKYADFLKNLTTGLSKLVLCATFPNRVLLAHIFLNRFSVIPLYFSRSNMRMIMEQRSSILEFVMTTGNRRVSLDYDCSRSGEQRLRLGFFIPQLYPRAETFVTVPLLKELNRALFSVHIFTVGRCSDELDNYFRSMVDDLTFLPQNIEDCVGKIRSDRMDVLIFPTNLAVGAGFYEILAAYRMAPVQIVETCCPVTTGLKNIDYYLSGSFTEPPGAEEFYSEKLVMVEGPAQAYHFFPEKSVLRDNKKWDRSTLGIPEDAIIFISGANPCLTA